VDSPALTPGQFSAVVTAITSAFGDPTRREIYLFAHENERGVTAAHVAERFELHPNVARHHLDKLAAGGYLDVVVERGEHGGAGRPSKHYRASTTEVSLDVPVGTDDVVLTLLGRALALLPPDQAQEMAEEVGIEYGRAMALAMAGEGGQRSFRAALHAVADALTAAPRPTPSAGRRAPLDHCPSAPIEHPVICAVDRGKVKGCSNPLRGHRPRVSLPRGDDVRRHCILERS
jgi:predicted ArsR family transcriptional regulator